MIFSSTVFLLYFLPCVILLYYVFKFHRPTQNIILLLFSLIFYAWGEPRYIFLMLLSILMNYCFGLLVDFYKNNSKITKAILTTMCVCNLALLYVFKYLIFSIETINFLTGSSLECIDIILPIGISFFTFQAMSYVFDVHRDHAHVQKNILSLALYISFFPQLVAGPIVRYESIATQIIDRKESIDKFCFGFCRFVSGLAKKVLIANNMAIVADQIYALCDVAPIPVSLAWVGSIAYSFQIFFDFSGYSDMAIGLGLMFGFKFEENFNYPYVATSIVGFWRRWHISLTKWFKEYLYIPLGGSRVHNKDKMIRNMLIVWIATGIWHGSSWNFVLWGMWNFLLVVFERIIGFEDLKLPKWVRHIYALFLINLSWVSFRSESISLLRSFSGSMFGLSGQFFSDYTVMFLKEYGVFFIAAIIFSMPFSNRLNFLVSKKAKGYSVYCICYPALMLFLFTLSLTYIVVGSYNPFIYFSF
ncbi:MAG: MBOAT family O-acyltransferase [Lachnospiraceae bacterium]